MTALPRRSVAVAGIVIDAQGRALLIRRPENGRCEPPGGVLELEETFADGACAARSRRRPASTSSQKRSQGSTRTWPAAS
ncbi:NUDIX hydrolase [Actinomadura bangladeshensis]|uniref:NUDIX hydrolase n=1 Tax=Actinomadura bangladeshensis TaxID=453573 RepID=UPI0030B845BA